jgi:hypothetical protein
MSLVLMATIWGVNFSVVKYGTQVMEPLAYNACATLVRRAPRARGRPRQTREHRDRWRLMALGVLGHCVYQILFISGIARTRAGTASLVIAASPAAVAIVARAFGHDKLSSRAVAGLALSIAGVFLVLGGSVSADGSAHLAGDLMILAAVCCWAFYTNWLVAFHAARRRSAGRRTDPPRRGRAAHRDRHSAAPPRGVGRDHAAHLGVGLLLGRDGDGRRVPPVVSRRAPHRPDAHLDVRQPAADRRGDRRVDRAQRGADALPGRRRGDRARRPLPVPQVKRVVLFDIDGTLLLSYGAGRV